MSATYEQYNGDGITVEFPTPSGSFDDSFQSIFVRVNGTINTEWSFNPDQSAVIFNVAPDDGTFIDIYRLTTQEDIIDFIAGSVTPQALNLMYKQLKGIVDEAKSGYAEVQISNESTTNILNSNIINTTQVFLQTIESVIGQDISFKTTGEEDFIFYNDEVEVARITDVGDIQFSGQLTGGNAYVNELWIGGNQIYSNLDIVQIKGEKGDQPAYEISVDNNEIRFEQPDGNFGPWYSFRGPTGLTGPKGDDADAVPEHEWSVQSLRFRNPDGSWGAYANLQGIQGLPGIDGQDGQQGVKGDKGDQGDQGIQGAVGPTGTTGATGATGLTGPAGPTGPTGPAGLNGSDGLNGTNGTDGAPGADGEDGLGVPAGGTTGQVLSKISDTDNDTEWRDEVVGAKVDENNVFTKSQAVAPVVAAGGICDLLASNNFTATTNILSFTNLVAGVGGDIIVVSGSPIISIGNCVIMGNPPEISEGVMIVSYTCDGFTCYATIVTAHVAA